jgi:hypothetical protein
MRNLTRLHGDILRSALTEKLRIVHTSSTIRKVMLGTKEIPNAAGAVYQMTNAGLLSICSTGKAGDVYELTRLGEAEALAWATVERPGRDERTSR